MKILFVADGRSPTALNWIRGVIQAGHEVHLVSTFVCQPNLNLESVNFLPVAFSGWKGGANAIRPYAVQSGYDFVGPSATRLNATKRKIWGGAALVKPRTMLRQWLGPFTLPRAGRVLRNYIEQIQPDLVHAMRMPYEGMAAAQAVGESGPPLLVSIWGNDFTLHAPSTPWMRRATQRTLEIASALHADCRRDVRLACAWGFDPRKPAIVLPGAGGIQTDLFHPLEAELIDPQPMQVINPRGVRAYICNEAFFRAIPTVLERFPGTRFICPNMAEETQVEGWVKELEIQPNAELLPAVPREQMAALFQRSQVVVSPSTHDGTPNSLLEAMACGCFPVAGDLESIREWITPGVNGLLVDARDELALAEGMVRGLENEALRKKAQRINIGEIQARAEYQKAMEKADRFYFQLLKKNTVAG
jgi:glycosyltransferase involved in cell wall biosynthesis